MLSYFIYKFSGSDENEVKIPIPDIDSETLKKIIEFCQHFEDEPLYVAPTTSEPSRPIPNPETFEMKFLLSFDNDEFRKIILGANYLDIPRLVDACCYRLAMMIEGKSVDEVRKIFEISSDYTADEEEQLRMENQWYLPNSKATNPE